jgi:hypothetical protein
MIGGYSDDDLILPGDMFDHPNIIGLSNAAFRAYFWSLFYEARYPAGDDRNIPGSIVRKHCPKRTRDELFAEGLWEELADGNVRIWGWRYSPGESKTS